MPTSSLRPTSKWRSWASGPRDWGVARAVGSVSGLMGAMGLRMEQVPMLGAAVVDRPDREVCGQMGEPHYLEDWP